MQDSPAFDRPCPDWYARPQLGVFIHWGMFAIPAYAPAETPINELFKTDYDRAMAWSPYAEWYWNAMRVPGSPTEAHHARVYRGKPYEDFRPAFEAAARSFDAGAWADLFAEAGASYVVFVTKHQDGYCLWPSEVANPHKRDWTSKRDYVGELAEAVRARGMRFGVYYSGGLDWTFHFTPVSNFGDMLACVRDVGLGYMQLGQASTTLSGGEAQRVKLATELGSRSSGTALYVLDEPTTGLHFDDVRKLLEVLQRLAEAGHTLIVIEHNLDVVKCADWLVDLGPEGGDRGGTLVASGTPEQVAKHATSHTGAYLKRMLVPTSAPAPRRKRAAAKA